MYKTMFVVKRNGEKEPAQFEKITKRIEHLSGGLDTEFVDPSSIAQKVIAEVTPGIHTSELDKIAARVCTSNATQHTHFSLLAGRLLIDDLHKNTPGTVEDYVRVAMTHKHHKNGKDVPLLGEDVAAFFMKHKDRIDAELNFTRDFRLEFFGFKTLEKSYLLRTSDNNIFERPQFLYMREAVQTNLDSIDHAMDTYYWLSEHFYTHATPTMFNAGTPHPQLSSCFVLYMKEDSVEGIYDTLKDCARISKYAGGIGLAVHNVRASGSYIAGTQGYSNGVVPMLTVYNNTARYIDQGGGKRKGSFAVYLEPWHADILDFIELKRNHGKEERRARDLHYAMWVPDLFMKRVEKDGEWSLFCPSSTPDDLKPLQEIYGEEFEETYLEMERRGLAVKTMRAQKVYDKIIDIEVETGEPYFLFKDHINRKSNQKNIGIVHSSNLCVAPETKILTSEGHVPISDLKDREVEVWNGEEFSPVTVRQTGINQQLIKVTLSNATKGSTVIECTPYHKFFIKGYEDTVEAQNLETGMLVIPFRLPDSTSRESAPEIYNYVVESVADEGRIDDTYCFTEPKRHAGIFNGVITGQCCEITLHTSREETAVCNLASLALPRFVDGVGVFNFEKLQAVTRVAVRNVDSVISVGFVPTEEGRYSNEKNRPIGIGVQGLADVFILMRLPFESEEARVLNREIFETIYYAACVESCELAKEKGAYGAFVGSPISEGKFQFDLWKECGHDVHMSGRYDWEALRADIVKHGIRNSTLVAPMPTASTAQIMGNTEGFEPITTNVMNRRVLAGEFPVLNKYLLEDLVRIGLWNKEIRSEILRHGGSIQSIPGIPYDLKELYKTVWGIKQSRLLLMSAERGPFVCQSQSLNIHMAKATTAKVATHHMKAWKAGVKTSLYYLRTKGHAVQNKFTVRHTSSTAGRDTIGTTPLRLPPPPVVLGSGGAGGLDGCEELVEGEDICLNCGS